eukprot:351086-Chlamydomonas_euryale.AAC.7
MVRRRTLQRMGPVLRMDEDHLPSSSAIWGCHEEGAGGGTTFQDFLKLPGHTKLIPWPEIRPAATERPGLVDGALCNDCDLAAEDMKVSCVRKSQWKE